jgi:hypothetical protein
MDKCPARVEHDLDGADDVSWREDRGVKFGVVVYRISTWQSEGAIQQHSSAARVSKATELRHRKRSGPPDGVLSSSLSYSRCSTAATFSCSCSVHMGTQIPFRPQPGDEHASRPSTGRYLDYRRPARQPIEQRPRAGLQILTSLRKFWPSGARPGAAKTWRAVNGKGY